MAQVSLTDWTRFLKDHPNAHFLQTGEWGQLKSAFGWDAARFVVDGAGAQVLFRRLPLGLTFAYLPKGIVSDGPAPRTALLWAEVETMCRDRHAILLKIEPDSWEGAGWDLVIGAPLPWSDSLRASSHSIQPRRTVTIDLKAGEEEILGRMKPKCRYNIRLASKKGVTVAPSDDLALFHSMMVLTGQRDGFAVHSSAYLKRAFELFHGAGMAELLVAARQGKPLAALMVFCRGARAWYLYGASSQEERELMPNYLLQWEAMRWAKARGCQEYDLWGVPDENESVLEAGFEARRDGLWGVYRFKRGFGGKVRRAAQAQDRVYQPLLYAVYQRRTALQAGP
jgi:peptidoglycan pentaglycine glycine transferase (the first glycine)